MAKTYEVVSWIGTEVIDQSRAAPVVRSLQLYAAARADFIARTECVTALVFKGNTNACVYIASPMLAKEVWK